MPSESFNLISITFPYNLYFFKSALMLELLHPLTNEEQFLWGRIWSKFSVLRCCPPPASSTTFGKHLWTMAGNEDRVSWNASLCVDLGAECLVEDGESSSIRCPWLTLSQCGNLTMSQGKGEHSPSTFSSAAPMMELPCNEWWLGGKSKQPPAAMDTWNSLTHRYLGLGWEILMFSHPGTGALWTRS